jgi:hypothetical protein
MIKIKIIRKRTMELIGVKSVSRVPCIDEWIRVYNGKRNDEDDSYEYRVKEVIHLLENDTDNFDVVAEVYVL